MDDEARDEQPEPEDDGSDGRPVLPDPDDELLDTLQEGQDPEIQREKYRDLLGGDE